VAVEVVVGGDKDGKSHPIVSHDVSMVTQKERKVSKVQIDEKTWSRTEASVVPLNAEAGSNKGRDLTILSWNLES
jgi:hypothetical protein